MYDPAVTASSIDLTAVRFVPVTTIVPSVVGETTFTTSIFDIVADAGAALVATFRTKDAEELPSDPSVTTTSLFVGDEAMVTLLNVIFVLDRGVESVPAVAAPPIVIDAFKGKF